MSKTDRKMQRRFENREPKEPKARKWQKSPPIRAQLPKGAYQIIFVARGGQTHIRSRSKAPDTTWMLGSAREGDMFVVRYWPSKKGWRVLDTRKAMRFSILGTTFHKWQGWRYLETVFPNEDSAVMAAITLASA